MFKDYERNYITSLSNPGYKHFWQSMDYVQRCNRFIWRNRNHELIKFSIDKKPELPLIEPIKRNEISETKDVVLYEM